MTRDDRGDGGGDRVRLSTSDRLTLIGLGLAQATVIVGALIGAYVRLAVVETQVEQLREEIRELKRSHFAKQLGPEE